MNIHENNSISAIVPTYNSADTLKTAIESIQKQTLDVNEIIIVDDGSIDNTKEIVKSLDHKNINYIYQKNQGPSHARNTGIKAAKSKWIAFLDSDDIWHEKKLELQIQLLKSNPDLIWSCSNYNMFENNTTKVAHPIRKENKLIINALQSFNVGISLYTDTMLIKKSIFDEVGLFDEKMRLGEDTDMWFRIALKYQNIGYISTPLATYHRSEKGLYQTPPTFVSVKYRISKMIQTCSCSDNYNDGTEFIDKTLKYLLSRMIETKNYNQSLKTACYFRKILRKNYFLEVFLRSLLPVLFNPLFNLYHKKKTTLH